MSRILLTHSYFYRLDRKQWNNHTPYPPLGTLYAASVLRNAGHETGFFDTCLAESPLEIEDLLKNFNPDYLVIYEDNFNFLTKMCLTVMRQAACEMISLGKQYGKTVIVSGSDATDHYPVYLHRGADFVITGEGEITLPELIAHLDNKKRTFEDIDGIAFLRDFQPFKTRPRSTIIEPDLLPLPAWDLVNFQEYRQIWNLGKHEFTLNIVTSRGCPFNCTWCSKPLWGHGYHSRSPEKVVNEIEYLMKNYHIERFWMCDDIFALDINWLIQFKSLILEKNLKFSYIIQSRADLLLKNGIAGILKETGLKEVWIGAESGSQKILDAMNKGITVSQIREALAILKETGISTGLFLQFGYPGETRKDISLTIDLIREIMPDNIGVSISYPLPGTPFYSLVKNEMSEKLNWKDSDDLAVMFHGTFPNGYYKKLHRFLHKELRKRQSLSLIPEFFRKPFTLKYRDYRSMAMSPYYILSAFYYSIFINL